MQAVIMIKSFKYQLLKGVLIYSNNLILVGKISTTFKIFELNVKTIETITNHG